MQTARAVLLAFPASGGRPWSSAGSSPKLLMPVATRPILFHALDALRAAGIADVAVLGQPAVLAMLCEAVGDGRRWQLRVTFHESVAPLGVREALAAMSAFVGGAPVVVQHADALLRAGLGGPLVAFREGKLDALAICFTARQVPRTVVAPVAAAYILSPHAVTLMRTGPTAADPLARLRRQGGRARVAEVDGCLVCHGEEAMLLDANRQALAGLQSDVPESTLEECEIQGSVVIHPTARLCNTLVRGPAIIGAHAVVVNSYVGPYTSIGADTHIEGTEIEHSIVMEGARLAFVGSRLETSVIGRGARIARRFDMPHAVRLSIGEGADVALS
jgi:glucose-1-phosphate thymidylyltransferase